MAHLRTSNGFRERRPAHRVDTVFEMRRRRVRRLVHALRKRDEGLLNLTMDCANGQVTAHHIVAILETYIPPMQYIQHTESTVHLYSLVWAVFLCKSDTNGNAGVLLGLVDGAPGTQVVLTARS